jgi:hypothetical protein
MTRQILGYAGWCAYMSATATIVTFVSALLFFTLGQPFGTLNDIASVFQLIFMLPLALILYRLFRSQSDRLSFLAAVLGVCGMLVGGIVQSLLVLGAITFQQSTQWFPAGTAIGGWLMLSSYLGLSSHLLPRWLCSDRCRIFAWRLPESGVLRWRPPHGDRLLNLGVLAWVCVRRRQSSSRLCVWGIA